MDKKLLLTMIGTLIVCAFSIAFFFLYEPTKKEPTNPVIVNRNEAKEEYESVMGEDSYEELSDAEKELLLYQDLDDEEYLWVNTSEKFVSLNEHATEFPDTKEYYEHSIELLEQRDYAGIAEYVGNRLLDYNFTTDGNSELIALYRGAAMMQNYTYNSHAERRNIIGNIKSPLALAMISLQTNPHYRNDVVLDINSLSPLVNGEIRLVSSKPIESTDSDYATYKEYLYEEELKGLYEYTFEIVDDDAIIKAIIAQSITHDLKIVGFYGVRNGHLYVTQDFWNNDSMWDESY